MESISEPDNGFYQGKFLPAHLQERAARVTDEPRQLTMAAFSSPEALQLCTLARRDLISAREREQISIRDKARRAP